MLPPSPRPRVHGLLLSMAADGTNLPVPYVPVPETIPDLTVPAVLDALKATRGNISKAADLLEKARNQLARFINSHPELVVARDDIRQRILDHAEDNVFVAVEKGEVGASFQVLALIGKERGWSLKEAKAPEEERPPVRQVVIRRYTNEEMEALRAQQLGESKASEALPMPQAVNE